MTKKQPAKPHIEVFQGPSSRWFIRLVGRNGETMLWSEAYWTKSNADRAAKNLHKHTGWAIEETCE